MKIRATSPLLVLALAGCAAVPSVEQKVAALPDEAMSVLQRAASAIQQSLQDLAEAEQFQARKQSPSEPRIYPQIRGMEAMVTMPWRGPIEQAVSKLAATSGYQVKFMGKPPVLPILVHLGREAATVSDHMRNLGIQAGKRADVIVDPRLRIVELRYGDGV